MPYFPLSRHWDLVEKGAILSEEDLYFRNVKWRVCHCPLPKWSKSHSVVSDSFEPHGLYNPWNSPGQNTGVGSLSLLQGIFPTQESNPGLPCCRWILYQLSHKGSPRTLKWVAYPFSSGSSWLRNQPGVSCMAGRFFTNWAMREVCPFPKSESIILVR